MAEIPTGRLDADQRRRRPLRTAWKQGPGRGSRPTWPRSTRPCGPPCSRSSSASSSSPAAGLATPPIPRSTRRRFPEHAALIDAVFGPEPDRSAGPPAPVRPPPPDHDGQPDDNGEPAPGTLVRYFGDYELLRRARPRRHGGRLQGPAGQPEPAGRPQDDPVGRRWPPTTSCGGSRTRPRRSPCSTTRTSCRSSRSASTRASATSA